MTDGEALRRAVLADPGDDTVRLAYADWLDEQSNSVTCHICGSNGGWMSQYSNPSVWRPCATCDGTGFEPDDVGHRARGIRWMCENPQNSWVCLCWNGEPTCNVCKWMGDGVAGIPRLHNNSTHYVVHRGFVNEIRLTAEDFELHAADLFRRHPLEKVVLVGKYPLERTTQGQSDREQEYGWLRALPGDATPHMLPHHIYDRLDGGHHWAGRHWRIYRTLPDALDALSRACRVVGRERAGKVVAA